MAHYAAEILGAQTYANLSDAYASTHPNASQGFSGVASDMGMTCIANETATSQTDTGKKVQTLMSSGADVVVFGKYLTDELPALGAYPTSTPLLSYSSWTGGDSGFDETTVNHYYATMYPAKDHEPAALLAFNERYAIRHGEAPGYGAALSYEMVLVVAQALRDSGFAEGYDLQTAMCEVAIDGLYGAIDYDGGSLPKRDINIIGTLGGTATLGVMHTDGSFEPL